MKIDKRTIAKHARLYVVALWGILSLLYVAGEPINENMSFGKFMLLKGIGLASLGLCCLTGKYLDNAGMLPDMKDEEDCEL